MRYFIVITILSLVVLLPGCRFGSNNINPKAEKEILNQYGGEYSQKEKIANERASVDENNNGKIFDLELKESGVVENYSKNLWVPASNIAYLFYTNFKNGNPNQTINVKIQLKDGQTEDFVYTGIELEKIKELIPLFDNLALKISEKDYKGIVSDLEIKLDIGHIGTLCDVNNSFYGRISETRYLGFSFVENEKDNKTFIKLMGVNMRGIKNTPFSVFIEEDTKVVESFTFEF